MTTTAAMGTALALAVAVQSVCAPGDARGQQDAFDTVLTNGRVMDPESGLDAIRNIGIRQGRVAAISAMPLQGRQSIDVTGLVVAPGFIDVHAHGQTERDGRLQAQDGVTTALEMEGGVYPAGSWYASREGRAPIHFGATAGHVSARIKLKYGVDVGHRQTSHPEFVTMQDWAYKPATSEEIERLVELLDQALDEGALGLGVQPGYTPAASREEILRIFQLAARRRATVFIHPRSTGEVEPASSVAAFQEALANAAATGAALHLVHVTSSGLRQTPLLLEMIAGARARGLDVTVEAYPHTAAATRLASAYFDEGWQQRLGISYGDLQWAATGERLTRESFEKYRSQPGFVIAHMIPPGIAEMAIAHPLVMVASDGIPFDTGGEHPRRAGTFSRVLGYYVRERGRLTLMDALRKMTIMPAQRLESFVPQMRNKGRLRLGADADITVFDPRTVADRATFEKPMLPSVGIAHVIVAGTFVVKGGKYVEGVFPGQSIRRDAKTAG